MTNKKIGNQFEQELCEMLSEYGFWVHLLNANKSGQPADIIAVKNKQAYLIDAKVVSTSRGFALNRVEENQDLAMDFWNKRGNGQGWFAFKIAKTNEIYMIPHFTVKALMCTQATLSPIEIFQMGKTLDKWVTKCK